MGGSLVRGARSRHRARRAETPARRRRRLEAPEPMGRPGDRVGAQRLPRLGADRRGAWAGAGPVPRGGALGALTEPLATPRGPLRDAGVRAGEEPRPAPLPPPPAASRPGPLGPAGRRDVAPRMLQEGPRTRAPLPDGPCRGACPHFAAGGDRTGSPLPAPAPAGHGPRRKEGSAKRWSGHQAPLRSAFGRRRRKVGKGCPTGGRRDYPTVTETSDAKCPLEP